VYRVSIDKTSQYHALAHGTTLHGIEALEPSRRHEALTYYHRTGPAGQAFAALPGATAPEIAVVGLGIGTLATYARPDQRWTFFEIDPAVEQIARTSPFFTFLGDCGTQCRVVLGDARLSLAGATEREYGVIVLDAFSSDAIPIHLITSEAVSLYLSRLAPGGALLVHISNRHLNLGPILARLGERHALVALERLDASAPDWPEGKSASRWIVMARSRADLGSLDGDPRWTPPVAAASTPLWTDDFSNILSVLSLR
jgi:spermidine synthase